MNKINPIKIVVSSIAAITIGLTTLVAYANNEPPQGPPPSFEDLDSNNDGQLSRDEVAGPLAQDFDRFDRNSDDYLSKEEIPPPPEQGQKPQ